MNRVRSWALVRGCGALLIAAAIVAQARASIGGAADAGRDVATTAVNFFSFFTVLSNLASVVVLALAAVWGWRRREAGAEPPALALALACVSTYMIITGIVYNLLLRQIELSQGLTVPWSNEVLHVVGPLVLVLDVLFAPGRRALPRRAVAAVVAVPIGWVAYTMVRGPLVTNPLTGQDWWYPYPFLDPNNPDLVPAGYPGVLVYVAVIALAFLAVASVVVAVGRRRAAA